MSQRSGTVEAGTRLPLGPDATIARAAEMRGALQAGLAGPGGVRVDLAGVERADVTLLQLLCAAHRTATASGARLQLAGPLPPAVSRAAEAAGLLRARGCAEGCLWSTVADGSASRG